MNIKLPASYLSALILTVACVILYPVILKKNNNHIMIILGAGTPTILALIGHYVTMWSLNKSSKKFYISFFIGSATRIVLLLSAIFLAFLYDKTHIISFTVALLSAYFLFLFAEIIVISTLRLGKSNK